MKIMTQPHIKSATRNKTGKVSKYLILNRLLFTAQKTEKSIQTKNATKDTNPEMCVLNVVSAAAH